MPDAFSIGPLAVPPTVLVVLAALASAYLALTLYRRKRPDEADTVRLLVDRGTNAMLLAFLVWKVFPVFQWTREVLADPMIILRLPGGRGGIVVGVVVAIIWMAPLFFRSPSLLRPAALAVGASTIGALVVIGGFQTASATPTYDRGELYRTEALLLDSENREPLIDGTSPSVLTFWATWCGPCHAELPVKKAAFAQTEGSVRFLAINMTNTESGPDAVARYVRENAIPYPVALDPHGRLASLFAVRGTPTTLVLSADGTVVARWMGPSDLGRIIRAVEETLPSATFPAER
jgi:thiol-disulfide isomerase/thioredoxin